MALHHLDNALLRVPAEALAMRCREHKASVLSEVVEAAAAIEVLGRGEVADERAAVAALANQLRGIKRKMDQGHSFFAHPPISPICRTPLFPYLTVYSSGGRHQDEHRHRHAVVLLGRDPCL